MEYSISNIGKIRTHVSRYVECTKSIVELQNLKDIDKGGHFKIRYETTEKGTIKIKADLLAQEKTEKLRILPLELLFPSPGDIPDPGIEPRSPAL